MIQRMIPAVLIALLSIGSEAAAQKVRDAGWYMRIRALATTSEGTKYAHDSGGVFGELRQSRNRKDRHDIPSYGAATFHVVFPRYYWNEDSGDYDSDYRHYNARRSDRRRVWTFQVKNQKTADLSNASLRLFVDDPVRVTYVTKAGNVQYFERAADRSMQSKFTLVDVDNHMTYTLDNLKDTEFSMDGSHVRTFRLVRGQVKAKDFEPVTVPE